MKKINLFWSSFSAILAFLLVFVGPVAFADSIDLYTQPPAGPGYNVTAVDGTVWEIINQAPSGTGLFDPFVRIQNSPTEIGMNTDAASGAYNDLNGNQYTHALQFSQLGTVLKNGVESYSFTLDINEPGSDKRFLSLDTFQIFKGSTNLATTTAGLTSVYLSPSTVLMDYTIGSSGQAIADIQVFIPKSNFGSFSGSDYLYLYTALGNSTFGGKSWKSEDGPEEWAALLGGTPPPSVPEPATMLLLGSGMLGVVPFVRRKFNR